MLDIKDFYHSITQGLLKKALNFVNKYIKIFKCDIYVIHHARKSLLFGGSHIWMKKQGLSDITVGAYNGSEGCEVLNTYTLNVLSKK